MARSRSPGCKTQLFAGVMGFPITLRDPDTAFFLDFIYTQRVDVVNSNPAAR